MFRFLLVAATFLYSAVAYAETVCPSKFSEFLGFFEADESSQRQHTRYPLSYSSIDAEAEPEPKIVKQSLTRKEVMKQERIIYPSRATQKEVPLQRKVSKRPDKSRVVQFNKPGSDAYSIEFVFDQKNGCWELVEVADYSL